MSNLYISLDELDKAISKSVVTGISLRTIIREVPTINITSVIDEMIKIRRNHRDTTDDKQLAEVSDSGIAVIEELKQRLTK